MSWNNVFSRLTDGNDTSDANRARTHRTNPRPAGVIRPGSATDAILSVLLNTPQIYVPCSELLKRTARSRTAVSLGLLYLREQGHIEAVADDGRNSRYQRYRITNLGISYAVERPSPTAQARAFGMARHAKKVHEHQKSRMASLRRCWNFDLPTVADQLRSVPGRHGVASFAIPLAGPQGGDGPLHAGELHLDHASRAATQAEVLPSGPAGRWSDPDGRGGLAPTGNAELYSRDQTPQERVRCFAGPAQATLPGFDVDHMAGPDFAITGVGTAPRHSSPSHVVPPQVDAPGPGHDARTLSQTPSTGENSQ